MPESTVNVGFSRQMEERGGDATLALHPRPEGRGFTRKKEKGQLRADLFGLGGAELVENA